MSPVNFQDFRNIAATRRDATISVNHSTGNLQVRDNHVLNRLITWVRNKISPRDPVRQQTEREAAYNRFLGAVGKEIRYRDQLGWVEDQLGADAYIKKPLTSRRVGEIMHQLDTRTTEAHRNTLVTAHYMAGREDSNYFNRTLAEKLDGCPVLQDVHFEFSPKEREALSQKVYDAVMEAGAEGRNDIGHAEGSAVALRVIDAELDRHEAQIISAKTTARQAGEETAQKAREQAAERPQPKQEMDSAAAARTGQNAMPETRTSGAARGVRDLLSRITRRPTGATGTSGATVATGTTRSTGATAAPQTKDLLDELKQADLPSAVRTDMKKSIKSGGIKSFDTFVQQANQKTYKWVRDNRFGKWYYDALKKSGVRVGNEVTVPIPLDEKVEQQISCSPYPVRYADVKVSVRREIDAYIAENGTGATSAT